MSNMNAAIKEAYMNNQERARARLNEYGPAGCTSNDIARDLSISANAASTLMKGLSDAHPPLARRKKKTDGRKSFFVYYPVALKGKGAMTRLAPAAKPAPVQKPDTSKPAPKHLAEQAGRASAAPPASTPAPVEVDLLAGHFVDGILSRLEGVLAARAQELIDSQRRALDERIAAFEAEAADRLRQIEHSIAEVEAKAQARFQGVLAKAMKGLDDRLASYAPAAGSQAPQSSAHAKPKVLIIGLRNDQRTMITREFGSTLDLDIIESGKVAKVNKQTKAGKDAVFVMADFIGHDMSKPVEDHPCYRAVHGGLTKLRDSLTEFYVTHCDR